MDMFRLEEFEKYGGGDEEDQEGDDIALTGNINNNGTVGIRSAEAEVAVLRRHCNYLPGTFHGGAIAVAAEEIARRCPPPSVAPTISPSAVEETPRVRYMEVHYMSAIKRRAGLAAVSTSPPGMGPDVTRVGLSEAGGAGGGALCAEGVLLWGGGRGGGGVQ